MTKKQYTKGNLINEGKTKEVWECLEDNTKVIIASKDDLTAGNGKKHDILPGKAIWATTTTCNVFEYLRATTKVPLAYIERIDEKSFLAEKLEMLEVEIVVRAEAHGSFLKRNTGIDKGHVFPDLIGELYLKTKDKRWRQYDIPVDDPFIVFDGLEMQLFLPDKPVAVGEHFLKLKPMDDPALARIATQKNILVKYAKEIFSSLKKGWLKLNDRKLVDFKIECGINHLGQLMVGDVIDNDSWRVVEDEKYIDKQIYRDGGDLSLVAEKYQNVANLTGQFLSI